MNRIEKLLLRGAGYSVLFMLIYFTLAAIMSFEQASIGTGRFFLILLFGYVLAMANFIFESVSISVWLKRLCVYAISALAFLFIFVLGGVGTTGARIFAALVVFTSIYGLGLLVACLIRRTVAGESASKAKGGKRSEKNEKKKKYESLYKD